MNQFASLQGVFPTPPLPEMTAEGLPTEPTFNAWLVNAKRGERIVYARCLNLEKTAEETQVVGRIARRACGDGQVYLFQKRNAKDRKVFYYIAQKR